MQEGQQDQDKSQKTEQPTSRRLEEARKKGNVPFSKEVNSFLVFLFISILVVWVSPILLRKATFLLTTYISTPAQINVSSQNIVEIAKNVLMILIKIALIPVFCCFIASILGNLLQNGVMFIPDGFKFDLKRISILSGAKRIFSLNSIVEFIKGLLKITLVGIALYITIEPKLTDIQTMFALSYAGIISLLLDFVTKMLITICIIIGLIAIFDLLYQRFKHTANLMMSKDEIKKELKDTEGDPLIKSKLKSIRMEKAKKRMLAEIPKADLVITNPTHYAVALKYVPDNMTAPILIAKGLDSVALKIREIATENEVPVVEDPPLARALYDSVELDSEIPFQYYKAVAKIISYLVKMKRGKFGKMLNKK